MTTALLPIAVCAALCSLELYFIFIVHLFRETRTSSVHLSLEFCENGPNLLPPTHFSYCDAAAVVRITVSVLLCVKLAGQSSVLCRSYNLSLWEDPHMNELPHFALDGTCAGKHSFCELRCSASLRHCKIGFFCAPVTTRLQ